MKRIILVSAIIVFVGFAIFGIVSYSAPEINISFADLNSNEVDQGVQCFSVASGEDYPIEEEANFKELAHGDTTFEEPPFEIMAVEYDGG